MALKSIKRLILSTDGASIDWFKLFSDAILNANNALLTKLLMDSACKKY
jgi:hypothetical protein